MQAQNALSRPIHRMTVLALAAMLGGVVGGYTLRGTAIDLSARPATVTEAATGTGPASRWTHEDRPAEFIQLGPASRWTHEEAPFTTAPSGPAERWTHEELAPAITR